jgi:hypothetical protein
MDHSKLIPKSDFLNEKSPIFTSKYCHIRGYGLSEEDFLTQFLRSVFLVFQYLFSKSILKVIRVLSENSKC